MTASGQRVSVENVAASGPIGQEQATPPVTRWAFCAICGLYTKEPVVIGATESASGPGQTLYADPECARAYAHTSEAPEWLRVQYRGVA